MPLRIVADAKVLKKAREQLIGAFRQGGAERISTVIGYPGGNYPSKVHWAEDLGIWLEYGFTEKGGYFNRFGTQNPKQIRTVSICCEINFPLAGIDRRTGGAVAEDAEGRLLLMHRGRIGGGRKGIGPELFWSHFDGDRLAVVDGEQEVELAVVGSVESPKLLSQIQFFVHEVERIKVLSRSAASDLITQNHADASVRIQDIGEEFEGSKTYSVTRTIEAACDHGIIVNRLRKRLQERHYSTGKDRLRDLYVHRNGRISSLFEVKTDTSTTSIYTAIGQLLIYSAKQTKGSRLVFVAPEDLSIQTRKTLEQIGIVVLSYRWAGTEPDFPGISDWQF